MYVETEEDVAGIVAKSHLSRLWMMVLVGLTAVLVALTMPFPSWRVFSPDTKPERIDPFSEYRCHIVEWRAKRDKAHQVLESLRRDQRALGERLKCLGVRCSAELISVPAARLLAEELAEIVHQIQEQDREVQRLDVLVAEAESGLRRIERRHALEATGLTRGEEERVVRARVELAEKLRSKGSDLMLLEVDETVDEILGAPKPNQQEGHR